MPRLGRKKRLMVMRVCGVSRRVAQWYAREGIIQQRLQEDREFHRFIEQLSAQGTEEGG